MNIRGTKLREKVANEYTFIRGHVEMVVYSKGILGDAGARVFGKMYCILLENKATKKRMIVRCGEDSARDLIKKLGLNMSDIFNPYRGTTSGGLGGEGGHKDDCTDRTAKQLYIATNWMLKYLSARPDGPLEHINLRVRSQMMKIPAKADILKINDILLKYKIMNLKEYILSKEKDAQLKREMVDFKELDVTVANVGEKSCFE